jgi:serpin B
MANKIFLQQGLQVKPQFLAILKFYLTKSENMDFKNSQHASTLINRFVDLETNGLISDIISADSIDSLTRIILVNAVYFKAGWKYKFNKQFTRPMKFTLSDNSVIEHAQGMRTTANLRIGRTEELRANILELPYANPNYNMYILIPQINDLSSLNRLVTSFNMSKIENNLRLRNVEVTMPAFEVSFEADVKRTLKSMGITAMFDPDEAEFNEISDEELFVQDVIHRSELKVNEEGSEAAATTAVVLGTKSGYVHVQQFRVDRPFVYIIFDNSNKIPLFIGRMVNPSTL